jgi:hypothetical protein
MTLSTLAILIGVAICIPNVYGLLKPNGFVEHARAFPRCEKCGYALMLIGCAWFLYNLNRETISDFAAYKNVMLLGFAALAVLACIFVPDFLAVRGLAICLLMLAWYVLSLTRWAKTEWRLVLVVIAYGWVLAGMWWTVSPWRLRDILNWMTATEARVRNGCIARTCFGLGLVALGLTVYR